MSRSRQIPWKIMVAVLVGALALLLVGGCSKQDAQTPANNNQSSVKQKQTKEKVTLYFGDQEAMYLVPEEREITLKDRSIEEIVIEELIKGPENPNLSHTVPEEAKLIEAKVKDGVAYVNFSKEFQTKHWGGSAGEAMTLYSITNSLAKLPEIQQVQFLLEGEKQEAILGHADTTEPISPNWEMVKD